MIEIKAELVELCKLFISKWFKDLKKKGEYWRYKEVMYWKNTPDFMIKYFDRYLDKLEAQKLINNVVEKTTLTEKQVRLKLRYWQTLSKILSLYEKQI